MSLQFDENKHGTRARFDEVVTAEAERRLKTGGMEGSSLVSAVITTLKKQGPLNPGHAPRDVDEELVDGCNNKPNGSGSENYLSNLFATVYVEEPPMRSVVLLLVNIDLYCGSLRCQHVLTS